MAEKSEKKTLHLIYTVMSRKIFGTRDNQVFEFNPPSVVRVFRAAEPKKEVVKKKRIIYSPPTLKRKKP